MNTQVNWQKIRSEFNRLADVDKIKNEVSRISNEIRNFDFHTVLTPSAQTKVKAFEQRYTVLLRAIQQAQRQVDREFNRLLRDLKGKRADIDKVVGEQRSKIEDVAQDLKKRFAATTTKRAAPIEPVKTASKTAKRATPAAKKAAKVGTTAVKAAASAAKKTTRKRTTTTSAKV